MACLNPESEVRGKRKESLDLWRVTQVQNEIKNADQGKHTEPF